MSRCCRNWKAGAGIVLIGALATGCAPGTRATTPASRESIPAQVAPVNAPTDKPVAPPAGPTQDPQAASDAQAVDRSLSQIEADLSTMDQAASSGEKDVPSN
jgi:hypothetical protein